MPDIILHRDAEDHAGALQSRMYSPLTGLLTSIGGLLRTREAPAFFNEGAELTGVHVMQSLPAPRPNSYHIGGFGVYPFESRIRVLGESLERYSGHAVTFSNRFEVRRATYTDLVRTGEPVLPQESFQLFRSDQLKREGFPFEEFDPDRSMGWVLAPSLLERTAPPAWIPAQFFLLGYVPGEEEPWLQPAVTTGTAAHITAPDALRGALEEMVQVDAVLGHWYGSTTSTRIQSDARTRHIDELIARRFADRPHPEFHLLPSADLPGLNVACILRTASGTVPAIAIGLGAGARLERVMYQALLEAVGVQSFAAWMRVSERLDHSQDSEGIYNLEGNISHYASTQGARMVEERFADAPTVPASDLPADDTRPDRQRIRDLVETFRSTGKRLYHADFSTADIAQLGFTAHRLWSPDTLSLCFPSAPPAAHRRFADYGGFVDRGLHPYP